MKDLRVENYNIQVSNFGEIICYKDLAQYPTLNF